MKHKQLLLAVALFVAVHARGEVCRFRALDAENPFGRWLGSQDVTCDGAGLPVPAGLWNVFARGEGVVSAEPMLVTGPVARLENAPPFGPGAIVRPLLSKGQSGVIYVPRRGSAFPVDAARVVVPADEPLWLFVLERAKPVALIPIAPLVAGTERPVDAQGGGPAAVIGWLQIPDDDRAAFANVTAVSAPQIHIGTREADPLPRLSLLHGAFYRIRDVKPGEADLRAEGHNWVASHRTLQVKPALTVIEAPLLLRASGTLTVHWSTEDDLAALDRSVGACALGDPAPQLVIALLRCPGVSIEADDCTQIREQPVDRFTGSMTFDDIMPGVYRADMRFGKLPPTFGQARVGALRNSDLQVSAAYFTAAGSITHGGEPLGEAVKLEFPQGIGFAPEDSEHFQAVLHPPPIDADTQVKVAACDGSPHATVLVDVPMSAGAGSSIDIPANELDVHVTDTFSSQGLAGANVKLEAMSARQHDAVVYTANRASDGQGRVLWSAVPIRTLHLTVTRAGYEKHVVDPFTMPRSGRHTVEVELAPLRGLQGKIVSERPFESAMVYWFSPAGTETEHADVADDGTFVYEDWHAPEETMAVVSASHPLWILRTPATARRQGITMHFPSAAVATFDVWLAASVPAGTSRYIGVAIGDLHVPQPVLALHQAVRRERELMLGAGPLHFRDILATGPIEVLLGPTLEEVAVGARNIDIFALEKFAKVPRQPLDPPGTQVVFVLKQR